MGAGCVKDQHTDAIDKDLKRANLQANAIPILLLLGAGESGKSTVLKQMERIHGKPVPEKQLISVRDTIFAMLLDQCIALVAQAKLFSSESAEKYTPSAKTLTSAKALEQVDAVACSNDNLSNHFRTIWYDPAIIATVERKSEFQLLDSASYFLKPAKLDELAKSDYLPSFDDYVRCRSRTTSVIESTLEVRANQSITVIDIGGQRNERRKWIHQFDRVNMILFVASLISYNQRCFEDGTTNRMEEDLSLFKWIVAREGFEEVSIILFLNKLDTFEEEIKKHPLTVLYPEYEGETGNVEQACEFIGSKYDEVFDASKEPGTKKQLFVHYTSAVDPENIEHILRDVLHVVLTKVIDCLC